MSDFEKKPGKKYPKLCSKCEVEKPENGWTPETYIDVESTICRKCTGSKKQNLKKVSSSVNKPKNSKKLNSQRKGLPEVYSFGDIESKVDLIKASIEKDDAILLTWFREKLGIPGNLASIKKNLFEKVNETFSDYSIRNLDWPIVERYVETKRTSHPYISQICRVAAVIEKRHSSVLDESFKDALTYAVHDNILETTKNQWTILGDETGQFEEFVGRSGNDPRVSTMLWIVVPPSAPLPAIPNLYFHGSVSEPHELKSSIRRLIEAPNVRMYSFSYDEGKVFEGQSAIGADPHLYLWNDTLPLVLEHILNNEKVDHPIQVFVEQVKVLQSGIGVLDSLISEYKTALDSRIWSDITFKETFVLQKNPCEHPWMGYPDALGHFFGPKSEEKLGELFAPLKERLLTTPYRQSSLNGSIRQLHKDTARPLVFLKSLADISIEDQRDYVEVFFPQAITESIQALNQGEWQKLLSHMDETSKTKQGQSASTLIHKRTDILVTLAKLEREPDRFNFCLAMLGTSNHIGAKDQAELCESVLNNLIEKGYNPPRERTMKFKNLLKGKADNYFDFSHISPFKIDEDFGEEEMKYLGAQAQSRALRGSQNDIAEALEIESFLLRKTNHEDDILRRMILHAELMMEKGNYAAAYEFLTVDLVKSVSKPVTSLFQDAYYLATLLKSGSLSTQSQKSLEILSDYIPRLLTDNHPSQRIAYWCVRWLDTLEEDMQALNETCLNHLITLMTIPIFTHDAPGIILSCELLDLDSRGYSIPKLDLEEFYNRVRENSQLTTQTWLEKHPPNEDDWLAPLNFNYR